MINFDPLSYWHAALKRSEERPPDRRQIFGPTDWVYDVARDEEIRKRTLAEIGLSTVSYLSRLLEDYSESLDDRLSSSDNQESDKELLRTKATLLLAQLHSRVFYCPRSAFELTDVKYSR